MSEASDRACRRDTVDYAAHEVALQEAAEDRCEAGGGDISAIAEAVAELEDLVDDGAAWYLGTDLVAELLVHLLPDRLFDTDAAVEP
jgi:hypothetical protein